MAKKEKTQVSADMKQYFDSYPKCNKFFRTTDGQVFLAENPAEIHQNRIDKDSKVEIFERTVEVIDTNPEGAEEGDKK